MTLTPVRPGYISSIHFLLELTTEVKRVIKRVWHTAEGSEGIPSQAAT